MLILSKRTEFFCIQTCSIYMYVADSGQTGYHISLRSSLRAPLPSSQTPASTRTTPLVNKPPYETCTYDNLHSSAVPACPLVCFSLRIILYYTVLYCTRHLFLFAPPTVFYINDMDDIIIDRSGQPPGEVQQHGWLRLGCAHWSSPPRSAVAEQCQYQ